MNIKKSQKKMYQIKQWFYYSSEPMGNFFFLNFSVFPFTFIVVKKKTMKTSVVKFAHYFLMAKSNITLIKDFWLWHIIASSCSHMFPTFKVRPGEFSNGPVVKNPPCSAGDTGLIPGQGTKIPHAMEQLSPCTAARESMHHSEKIPHDSTKSSHATTKTGGSQINKYIF